MTAALHPLPAPGTVDGLHQAMTELVAALNASGYRVPASADWTEEINLRQVERNTRDPRIMAAVAELRAALETR